MRSVDPKVYTKKYYLTDCTGFNEFILSYGEILEPRFVELIKYFTVKSGMKVLDIGCGRGELVLYTAKQGADSIGIDYSEDAIKLAELLKKKQLKKIAEKMSFLVMDAKKMAFPKDSFDMIILTDVVEHLYEEELDILFGKIKNILKKDGIVVIHTAPNKWFNDIAYPLYCYPVSTFCVMLWNMIFHKSYPYIAKPSNLRTDSHAIMHINEPTYFSLKKLFDTYGFKGKIVSTNITVRKPILGIKDKIFNLFVFLHPFSSKFPLNILLGSDFVSILKK